VVVLRLRLGFPRLLGVAAVGKLRRLPGVEGWGGSRDVTSATGGWLVGRHGDGTETEMSTLAAQGRTWWRRGVDPLQYCIVLQSG
jgi:hypothetical protein